MSNSHTLYSCWTDWPAELLDYHPQAGTVEWSCFTGKGPWPMSWKKALNCVTEAVTIWLPPDPSPRLAPEMEEKRPCLTVSKGQHNLTILHIQASQFDVWANILMWDETHNPEICKRMCYRADSYTDTVGTLVKSVTRWGDYTRQKS